MEEKKHWFDVHGFTCKLCAARGKTVNVGSIRSVATHIGRSHKDYGDLPKYVVDFHFAGEHPLCACGCGGQVLWNKGRSEFNTYLNGHNEAGFKAGTYIPAQEVKDRAAEGRRRALRERGEEISANISAGVKEAYARNPEFLENVVKARKLTWSDPAYKERLTEVRKRVWAEQHDELCEKIFTPEFRKNVSLRNQENNLSRTSDAEVKFVERLRHVFGDSKVVHKRWVNWNGGSKEFDVYLPDLDVLVEFDGTYWHGLDLLPGEEPGVIQAKNVENDKIKEQVCEATGMRLLRIREDVELQSIQSVETLFNVAYKKVPEGLTLDDLPKLTSLVTREDFLIGISNLSSSSGGSISLLATGLEFVDAVKITLGGKTANVGCFDLSRGREKKTYSRSEKKKFGQDVVENNLLLFYSDEWNFRREICISMVKHRLGISDVKVNARDCEVRRISLSQSRSFLEKNHLRRSCHAKSECLGMFDNNGELVSVMTFRRPNVQRYNDCVEVARFASKLGISVRGAVGKMIHVASEMFGQQGLDLMTYVHRCHGRGEGYVKAGMVPDGVSEVGYDYSDGVSRFNRQKYQNDKARGMTEEQVAEEAGVFQVPSAGNLRFVLRRKNVDSKD